MVWFTLGLGVGVLLTIPVIYVATRRTARRVQLLEQRARSAERLAELGTLTGGLAHEIKNPLSTIGLNLQLVSETLDEAELPQHVDSRMRNRITKLAAETDRLRGILEDFLSFAGRIRLSTSRINLNEIIEQLVDFYLPQAQASGVQLRTQLDPAAGDVMLDPTLFKQAVLNLLINATQAMVDARYIDRPHGGANELIIRSAANGDDPAVHVIDTGPGINDATLQKIFQPYITTKPGGTGLGLATARRIIEEHGGRLDVISEPGRGCDLTIQLPRNGPH